jgi:putative intracellular protease/amidase
MKTRNCYLFVFDGFADWEPALATAALNQFTDFRVITFSTDGKPVTSMGNLTITPATSIDKFEAGDVSLLILPGGEAWEEGKNHEIIPLLQGCLDKGKMVAAICGATAFLAEKGYLDNVKHTSNNLEFYLKHVSPSYKGEKLYENVPAVRDANLITASGAKPLDFAREILNAFDLFENQELKTWFSYFTWEEEHKEVSTNNQ